MNLFIEVDQSVANIPLELYADYMFGKDSEWYIRIVEGGWYTYISHNDKVYYYKNPAGQFLILRPDGTQVV